MPKATKPIPINWESVRAEYEAGGVSCQQLADKLRVSRKTVERHSKKESWSQGVRKVSEAVSEAVSEKVRDKVISRRVEKTLTDLDMIDSVIASTYMAITAFPDSFKTSGEAVSALDRMLKIKLEYSDEHIQEWLMKKGYVAVPIVEFASPIEMGKGEIG